MRISRRKFIIKLGQGTMLVASGGLAAMGVRFLNPNLETPLPGPVEVGRSEDFAPNSITYLENARSYLVRDQQGGFYALIASCTHLGCTPRLEGGELVCPCHGSRFTLEGSVINGPAPRPLDRAFVDRAASGKLLIDRGRIVEADYRLRVPDRSSTY